uniref:Uncharacterized protein n=1 Tax=viral metagenome TaxID=1070528 RepID=A0A6M3IS41_9ZZZZ
MPELTNTEGEKVVDAQLDAQEKRGSQTVVYVIDTETKDTLKQMLIKLGHIETHLSILSKENLKEE